MIGKNRSDDGDRIVSFIGILAKVYGVLCSILNSAEYWPVWMISVTVASRVTSITWFASGATRPEVGFAVSQGASALNSCSTNVAVTPPLLVMVKGTVVCIPWTRVISPCPWI